jgi:hypothetical protein
MIRTTPFRRMILHRSQRGLTDARTFMTLHILVRCAVGFATDFSDATVAADVTNTCGQRRAYVLRRAGDPPAQHRGVSSA